MAWNPHLKSYNDNRGYVNTRIAKDAMTADFRRLDYVTTPGTPRPHEGVLRDPGRGAGASVVAAVPLQPAPLAPHPSRVQGSGVGRCWGLCRRSSKRRRPRPIVGRAGPNIRSPERWHADYWRRTPPRRLRCRGAGRAYGGPQPDTQSGLSRE
jgi:hypothetical protein